MARKLKTFSSDKFGRLRVIEWNGDLWFSSRDVAFGLDFDHPGAAIGQYLRKEDTRIEELHDTHGKSIMFPLINLNGVATLSLASRADDATDYYKWVKDEVASGRVKPDGDSFFKTEEAKIPFWKYLDMYLKESKQTLSEFSVNSGVSYNTLYRLKYRSTDGSVAKPTAETVAAVAAAMCRSYDDVASRIFISDRKNRCGKRSPVKISVKKDKKEELVGVIDGIDVKALANPDFVADLLTLIAKHMRAK